MEYDEITAFHYASYRPALHREILETHLATESFDSGLDIGCGTGQSAIALAAFCTTVAGIDSSPDMLAKAITHPNVNYEFFDRNKMVFEDHSFHVITLAGSLWYAKSQKLLDEITRVSVSKALILVYDFEILLEDILSKLGFVSLVNSSTSYNHEEDFSGLNIEGIQQLDKGLSRISLQIKTSDLAHLVLSVKEQHNSFCKLLGTDNLHTKVVDKLNVESDSGFFDIQANTFFTLYQKK